MAMPVGARMETVAPKRSLFGPDYLRLAALAVVSVAVHLWLIADTRVTARDGIGFARYAMGLQEPANATVPVEPPLPDEPPPPDQPAEKPIKNGLDVIARAKQAPGYPTVVWVAAKFVRRAAPDLPHPEGFLLAAQITSALAALLLVVPTYLTGRMLFGRSVGFAGALLFQVLPVPARTTSDAMTEGLYLLAAATAIMLGVRAVRRPGVGGFLACGLVSGITYLIRPEGLIVPTAVGLVAAWLGLTRVWPRDVTLGRLTALAVGVALVGGPYVLLIGKLTNKPTGNELLPSLSGVKRLFSEGPPATPGPAGGPVFAAWWSLPDGTGPVDKVRPAVVNAVKETGKSLFYVPAGLAVLGAFLLRRRIAAEPGLCVLLAVAGVNFLVLLRLGTGGIELNGTKTYYIGEHHTVLLALIGCLFAAAALEPVAAALAGLPRIGRLFACPRVPAWFLVGLVAAALPATLKPLHANREGHKHAGQWLAGELRKHAEDNEQVVVIDPFEWVAWYSGRTLYRIEPDPKRARVRYVVLDNKNHTEDHTRLPLMATARAVAESGKVVYHWPEDGPVEQAQVKIYKTVGPSEWDKYELRQKQK
ncbi:MAG: hypothetical protein JWO38_1390 [Gemmataceae bacterium]|nr:hypothetical protein [Gemmataceae bacterium]